MKKKEIKKFWRKILGYQVGEKVKISWLPDLVWAITDVSIAEDGERIYTIETEDEDLLYVTDKEIVGVIYMTTEEWLKYIRSLTKEDWEAIEEAFHERLAERNLELDEY